MKKATLQHGKKYLKKAQKFKAEKDQRGTYREKKEIYKFADKSSDIYVCGRGASIFRRYPSLDKDMWEKWRDRLSHLLSVH